MGSNIWFEINRGQVPTRGEFHASIALTVCSHWPEVQAQYNLEFEFAAILFFFFSWLLETLFVSILSSGVSSLAL